MADTDALDELLSRPTPGAVETMRRIEGDILFLGVAGKMGPTMARMARRASDEAGAKRRVIGVSRFSSVGVRESLETAGIETIAGDLLSEDFLQSLPGVENVIFMAAHKFGSTGNEPLAWAMNCFLPGMVARRFWGSRIAAFSTGNVYPLVAPESGGSTEDVPAAPIGEYAMSCLGRERMFQYYCQAQGNPVVLLRLNYACELRYGVLVDIALKVWRGEAIDLTTGYVNVLWQGDANAMSLQALGEARSPAAILNIAGPEILRVRDVAEGFGRRFGKTPVLSGTEAPTAFLNDATRSHDLFGKPSVNVEALMGWITAWVQSGGDLLGKPTHFQTRDGKF
ncbi:MAG: NAD(P)-dependent oxidoreductase [Candidatus Hydrogenedentes bacterium]|nr:NAD(P)-dependent oxidoreductase [Candidatus Hydrogenedentota bacterium]